MKILVTGGAGFIGSHLVEKLVEQQHGVIVLDDLSAGKLANLVAVKDKITLKVGSICDAELVQLHTANVDIIFHLATQCLVKGLEDPRLMYNVNDIGTFNVCMAAKEHTSKLVYIGTSEEYGPQETYPIREDARMKPVSIYGLTKLIGEQYVRFFHKIYNVPAVIIRGFNTYGPRHREDAYAAVITAFMKRLGAGLPPMIEGDGLQTRDFTYISDIVDGILLLSELENGEVVNIGSGKDLSIIELADTMIKVWKQRLQPVFTKPRPNDLRRLLADITLAKSYGYQPKVSFEEGLRKYVEWHKRTRHWK